MKSINKLLIIFAFCVTVSACSTVNNAKLDDFKVNMNSPQITIGEIEIQFETLMGLGRLKKQNVTVTYFPKEDAICLKYKYEFYTYNQFWSKKGRLNFISALQKYNEDYEARNLQRNSNTSQQKYGTVRGYLVWQQFSFTVQAFANMNVDLGYVFRDRAPYFSVYQRDTEYIDEMARDNNRISPNVTMYFTRAQAAELAEIFGQYIIPGDIQEEYKEADIPAKKDDADIDAY